MEPGAVDAIISGTGNDVRQTLNHLALYSANKDKKVGADSAKRTAKVSEKDIKIVRLNFLLNILKLIKFLFRVHGMSFVKFSHQKITKQ
jgi:hypothetical protein